MDVTITEIGAVVVEALRAAGYKESTVGNYKKTVRVLVRYGEEHHTSHYTLDLGAGFASLTTSPRTGRFSAQRRFDYRRLVAVFDRYVLTGHVDLSVQKRGGGGCRPMSSEFGILDVAWEADMADRDLALATREAYGRLSRSYLGFLESRRIYCLDDADGETVLSFLSPKWAKSSLFWVVSNFRPFLVFTGRDDLVLAVQLAGVKRSHSIIEPLGDDVRHLVIAACASDIVCARNAAITLLALSTGLRASDIVDLRLSDVDWRGKTISIVQQKTHNPLTVPMTELLAVKLADYVLYDRPKVSDDHLFLRHAAPYVGLGDHAAIYKVTVGAFRTAGVADSKAGTRLLRHNAASQMLRAGTPLPTISAVLGHASEESTRQYMSVDENRLACCVLPMPEGARP
ncbi:MAG: tyrosine-type recombinase/integrase [Ferrimicrobium sp.]